MSIFLCRSQSCVISEEQSEEQSQHCYQYKISRQGIFQPPSGPWVWGGLQLLKSWVFISKESHPIDSILETNKEAHICIYFVVRHGNEFPIHALTAANDGCNYLLKVKLSSWQEKYFEKLAFKTFFIWFLSFLLQKVLKSEPEFFLHFLQCRRVSVLPILSLVLPFSKQVSATPHAYAPPLLSVCLCVWGVGGIPKTFLIEALAISNIFCSINPVDDGSIFL